MIKSWPANKAVEARDVREAPIAQYDCTLFFDIMRLERINSGKDEGE
jgi:hypothetical protein